MVSIFEVKLSTTNYYWNYECDMEIIDDKRFVVVHHAQVSCIVFNFWGENQLWKYIIVISKFEFSKQKSHFVFG